jgi:IclR family mhp operon transcriptional activator
MVFGMVSQASSSNYRYCQSLVKGLDLLSALNRLPSGSGSISELALHTGIHRTTLKRLLETLRDQGYVSRDAATNHYQLTFRVQQLSHGFRDTVSLVEHAWPDMYALSKSVIWPCSLTVPEYDNMVVRSSTRLYSRLSFHPGMPGRRLPMLSTAAGRAYISHVSDDERKTLLQMLKSRNDDDAIVAKDDKLVRSIIQQTRARGYALSMGEWRDEPRFGGIALPLRCNGEVQAAINVIFLVRAVQEQRSLPKLAAELRATVDMIEERLPRGAGG